MTDCSTNHCIAVNTSLEGNRQQYTAAEFVKEKLPVLKRNKYIIRVAFQYLSMIPLLKSWNVMTRRPVA